MKKDLFDIIRSKSFDELSSSEREEVSEMASNAVEYDNLKAFMTKVDGVAVQNIEPSERVKNDLNDLFDQVHGQRRYAWYMSFAAAVIPEGKPIHKQPLFYAAALILLALLFVPLSYMNINNDKNVIAQQEVSEEQVIAPSEEIVDEANEVAISTNVDTRSFNAQERQEVTMQEALSDMDGNTQQVFSGAVADAEVAEKEEDDFRNLGFSAPAPMTTTVAHPDGVFKDWAKESNYSIPASKQPELLDLLTATF